MSSLRQFAATGEAVAATTKQTEKVRIPAAYLQGLRTEDAALAAVFFTGRPLARIEEKTLLVGSSLLWQAVSLMTGADAAQAGFRNRHAGPGNGAVRAAVRCGNGVEAVRRLTGAMHVLKQYSRWRAAAVALVLLAAFCRGITAGQNIAQEPTLALLAQYPSPVITATTAGAEDVAYGFEGGSVIKLAGTYHLFTTEMLAGPLGVKTRLAHWKSADRIHWRRVSTLYESSGDFTGRDARASLWAPMPVYNGPESRWNLVYVAYRCAPSTPAAWRGNYEGRIWRAVSTGQGRGGIDGPYQDAGVLLQPDAHSQSWEGLQGTDSFFPYQVGGRWLAFYGSANTEHLPIEHWRVGLAEAPALRGPWQRLAGVNPLQIERHFAENPIVTQVGQGYDVAVYDTDVEHPNAIGYTWSPPQDGLHWAAGRELVIQPQGTGFWADTVRTPLGLIAEGNGNYTLFYTGYRKLATPGRHRFSGVGFVTLKVGTNGQR